MNRVLSFSLLAIACIFICSCKNKNGQVQSTSAQTETTAACPAETLPGMPSTIQAFYKAYCTDWDGESKTDSILSEYCTQELKDCVMDCVGEYDFVLDGGIYSEIYAESFRVVKKN